MEGEHDKNDKAPQIQERQTGCGVADFLDSARIGQLEPVCRKNLAFARRRLHPDIHRGARAICRTGGSTFASDGGTTAPTLIIAARGFDRGELIAPGRLTKSRSLMQELIVAPRQER
jgi:hypothetical protein